MANRKTATQMLAEACGKPFDEVLEDSSRTFYMSPDEAVEYGLIDKVRGHVQQQCRRKRTLLLQAIVLVRAPVQNNTVVANNMGPSGCVRINARCARMSCYVYCSLPCEIYP